MSDAGEQAHHPPENPGEATPNDAHEPGEDERADELDGLRIRQLSALRRGAYRGRSYALIGVGACVVTAIQLLLMMIAHVRGRGWGVYQTGCDPGECGAVMRD